MAEPPGFDPDTPAVSRLHNYWLGGLDHYQHDRDQAGVIGRICPEAGEMARSSRAFTARAVTWAAGQGITQFIDLGCGFLVAREFWDAEYPGSVSMASRRRADEDAHVTPRTVNPAARVAYVDNDWLVTGHGSMTLAPPWVGGVAVVQADLRDPAAVMADPGLLKVIDLARPVCVILSMVLHYLPAARARQVAAGYAAATAPGSYLAVSTIRADDAALWPRLRDAWPGQRPGWASMPTRPLGPTYALGGIGRKPAR